MKLKERRKLGVSNCVHPPSEYVDQDDTQRHEWTKTNCGMCGKFLGYRPRDCKKFYKQRNYAIRTKGRDRDG